MAKKEMFHCEVIVLHMAGGRKFLNRNPSLSLQAGDSTAGVRMDAIIAENITNYFDQL